MLVNGEKLDLNNITIQELLKNLNVDIDKVVVEVNLNIVPKEKYSTMLLNENDKVEIISFVGGG